MVFHWHSLVDPESTTPNFIFTLGGNKAQRATTLGKASLTDTNTECMDLFPLWGTLLAVLDLEDSGAQPRVSDLHLSISSSLERSLEINTPFHPHHPRESSRTLVELIPISSLLPQCSMVSPHFLRIPLGSLDGRHLAASWLSQAAPHPLTLSTDNLCLMKP